MIEVLNLNHPELSAERRDLIDDLERELAAGTSPAQLRFSYLEESAGRARPSFANVALGYLRGQANAAGPPG